MKKIAILQSNYIPWKSYFDIIKQVDTFVVYDEVQYTKNDWRNRNKIKTPNGLQWLTIPVKQKSLDQKIFETEVAEQSWRRKHLNSIRLNYARAPFFDLHSQKIEKLYEGNEILLSEINLKFIKGICKILNIQTQIIDSMQVALNICDTSLSYYQAVVDNLESQNTNLTNQIDKHKKINHLLVQENIELTKKVKRHRFWTKVGSIAGGAIITVLTIVIANN
jgi:hypothetical protein